MCLRKLSFVALAAIVTGLGTVAEARTVIQNKGSDTLVNVAQAWAEEYRKVEGLDGRHLLWRITGTDLFGSESRADTTPRTRCGRHRATPDHSASGRRAGSVHAWQCTGLVGARHT